HASKKPAGSYETLVTREQAMHPLKEYLELHVTARGLNREQPETFNSRARDAWIRSKAKIVPGGSRVLDVGAGTAPYRDLFSHCEYRTHDFAEYGKYQDGSEGQYTKLDYVSDICSIPVLNSSFDVVVCTEVLEHVPRPIDALQEMVRVLRPNGRLFITAPLGSGQHQQPFHFYGGFTEFLYQKFLREFACEVVEITPNHGFFAHLAQECCRFGWTFDQHEKLHGVNGKELKTFMMELLAPYLFGMDKEAFIRDFTVGFHVEACKSN